MAANAEQPKLLYVYTGETGRITDRNEINFSSDYHVEKAGKNMLTIRRCSPDYSGLYGDMITDIKLLVGRNGSGKSTILDIIGNDNSTLTAGKSYARYVVLYILNRNPKNQTADFYVEGMKASRPFYTKITVKGTDSWTILLTDVDSQQNTEMNTDISLFDPLSIGLIRESGEEPWYTTIIPPIWHRSSNIPKYSRNIQTVGEETFLYAYRSLHDNSMKSYMSSVPEGLSLSIGLDGAYSFTFDTEVKDLLRNLLYNDTPSRNISEETILQQFLINYLEMMFLSVSGSSLQRDLINKPSPHQDSEPKISGKVPLTTAGSSRIQKILSQAAASARNTVFGTSRNKIRKITGTEYVHYLRECMNEMSKSHTEFITERELRIADALIRMTEHVNTSGCNASISDTRIQIPLSQYQMSTMSEQSESRDPVYEFLQELRTYNILSSGSEFRANVLRILNVSYTNLSTGEMKMINLFSSIFSVLNKAYGNPYEDYEIHKLDRSNTFLLLLDEPDANFHPEWSRQLISRLVKELNRPPLNNYSCRFQIIISTHSPILLSDIPREMISCLYTEKDPLTGNLKLTITDSAPCGFMSNIMDIMKESMFVEAPHGEFAREYTQKIVEQINEFRTGQNSTDFTRKIQQLRKDIQIIGDDVIRNRLDSELIYLLRDHFAQVKLSSPKREEMDNLINRMIQLEADSND